MNKFSTRFSREQCTSSQRHARHALLAMLVSVLSACATVPGTTDTHALIPVRHLVADLNGSGGYQISPDGQRLLWIARQGLGSGLFVKNLQTGRVDSYKVPGGTWARDSRHVLFMLQNNGDENEHVWSLDTDQPAQAARDLTPFEGAKSLILRRLPDSDDLIIQSNRRDPKVFDVYRHVASSGELTLLATNPGNVGYWLVDDKGQVIGRARLDCEQWIYETPDATQENTWTARFTVGYFDAVIPVAASRTPGHWWALSNRGRDKLALVDIHLADGSERLVYSDPLADVTGLIWSHKKQAPLGAYSEPDAQHWQTFDPDFALAIQRLRGQTDARITIGNFSDDERWMNATVTRHNGGEHVLYDLKNHTFQVLAELGLSRMNAISPLAVQQPVTFKSHDGLDLHGYLSLPPSAAKPYPTVVYVHGGPWARDLHHNNDPMLPFFTNRGYAVLQVNYRGSSGYGKAFQEAAIGEFAGKMHSDLTDAVDALVAQGVVDPQRVAMVGASYGGYASLVGMTHTPGKFRCAISTVGMSDLVALQENAPPYWELGKAHWSRYAGNPADPEQRSAMKERSPLYKAHRVQGPILLMHGAHDPRVKVSQSVQMAEALKAQGKSVELLLFNRAGHGVQRWQDNLRAYRKTEDFLASCLGGRSRGFDFFEIGAWLF